MSSVCPKCGSVNVLGPHYRKGWYGTELGECLEYTCARCGYLQTEPTLDSSEKQASQTAAPVPSHNPPDEYIYVCYRGNIKG